MIPRPPRGVGRAQALAAALLAALVAIAVGQRLDPGLGDRALALAPTPGAEVRDKIAVLTITEDTLAGFAYRSPIDRGFLADLILRLEAAGARAPSGSTSCSTSRASRRRTRALPPRWTRSRRRWCWRAPTRTTD